MLKWWENWRISDVAKQQLTIIFPINRHSFSSLSLLLLSLVKGDRANGYFIIITHTHILVIYTSNMHNGIGNSMSRNGRNSSEYCNKNWERSNNSIVLHFLSALMIVILLMLSIVAVAVVVFVFFFAGVRICVRPHLMLIFVYGL